LLDICRPSFPAPHALDKIWDVHRHKGFSACAVNWSFQVATLPNPHFLIQNPACSGKIEKDFLNEALSFGGRQAAALYGRPEARRYMEVIFLFR
jgi:hypothetical protein